MALQDSAAWLAAEGRDELARTAAGEPLIGPANGLDTDHPRHLTSPNDFASARRAR